MPSLKSNVFILTLGFAFLAGLSTVAFAAVQFEKATVCGKYCKAGQCATVPNSFRNIVLCGGCEGTRLALNNDCYKVCPQGFKPDNVRDICVPNGHFNISADTSFLSFCNAGKIEEYSNDQLVKVFNRPKCQCPIRHCRACINQGVQGTFPDGNVHAAVISGCTFCQKGYAAVLDVDFPAGIACLKKCPPGYTVASGDQIRAEFNIQEPYVHLTGGAHARYCVPPNMAP